MELPGNPLEQMIDALRAHIHERLLYVIFESDPIHDYYVQVVGHEEKDLILLHCEAVSDKFLKRRKRLGAEGSTRLRDLGWQDPDHDVPNWWRVCEVRTDEDLRPIAEMLLHTLRNVYGLIQGSPRIELGEAQE